MSDLRDFTPSTGDSPRFIDEPVTLQPIRDDVVIVDDGGLSDMHIRDDAEEEGTGRSKLLAGLAVALMVGVAGAYGVSQYMKDQPVVADNSLPAPSEPSKTAAMTPPPAPTPAPATEAEATAPVTAPAAPDVVKPAPVTKQAAITNAPKVMPTPKSSSTSTASNATTMTPAPVEQPVTTPAPAPVQNQASNVPEPVSPTPPAASFAGNPALNEQSAQQPADATAAPQATAPAETAPAPAAPAEPAAPAPAPAEAAPATPAQ